MNPYVDVMFKEIEMLEMWYNEGYVTLTEYFDIKHRIVENCKKKLGMKGE